MADPIPEAEIARRHVILQEHQRAIQIRCSSLLVGAVEEVHRRPQEIVEIGFETGFAQRRDESVEDVGERASDGGLVGQGTRVGLVLVGACQAPSWAENSGAMKSNI